MELLINRLEAKLDKVDETHPVHRYDIISVNELACSVRAPAPNLLNEFLSYYFVGIAIITKPMITTIQNILFFIFTFYFTFGAGKLAHAQIIVFAASPAPSGLVCRQPFLIDYLQCTPAP